MVRVTATCSSSGQPIVTPLPTASSTHEDEPLEAAPTPGGGTSSTYGAAFNILCTVLGTGLLQLPYGVQQSGWLGVGLLIIMGIMACYTARTLGKLLVLVQERSVNTALLEAPQPAVPTYGDLGAAAFGERGRVFVNIQMHVTLLMVATIYHLLAALNIHWLCKIDLAPSALLIACVIWFHVFIKSLGDLAVLSYANLAINFTLLIVVIVETLSHPPATVQHDLIVSDVMSVGGAFASFGFAYGCHPVLPDVYASMKKPWEYTSMVYGCFAAALALYLPLVLVAYSTYGHGVKSPMYETPGISELPVMRVIKAITIFPMIFTYPLVLTPPEGALERALKVDESPSPRLYRIGLRTLFVVFTTGVTILVRSKDNFGPLVDLVSSCTSTFTVFLLPCIFHIKLHGIGGEHGLDHGELAVNAIVIIIASIGAVFGTVKAIEDLSSLGSSEGSGDSIADTGMYDI